MYRGMFDFEDLASIEQEALQESRRRHALEAKLRLERQLAAPTKDKEIRVCTYNLLAPCYFRTQVGSGGTEAGTEFWRPRFDGQLAAVYGAADPDILCLQEVWFAQEALDILHTFAKEYGYEVLLCQRQGWECKDDGCAVLVRTSRLEVLGSEDQVLCQEGSRVLMKLALRVKLKNRTEFCFVLGCTHLTYPHSGSSNRLRMVQAHNAGRALVDFGSRCGSELPVAAYALAGDFNVNVRASDVGDDAAVGALLCQKWRSAYAEVHGFEAGATHRTHRGTLSPADYVFLRGGLRATSAAVLPLAEDADVHIPQVQLGGAASVLESAVAASTKKHLETLTAWSQFSDHRPVLVSLAVGATVDGDAGREA